MDELLSKTWKDITPQDWHGVEPAIHSEASKGKVLQYEKEYVRKDGSRIPVDVLVSKYIDENGEPQFYYLFIMDISERKRVEEIMREKAANLAMAQRIAHMGNWARDFKKDTIAWSDEAYRIFGLEPGSKKMTYDMFLASVHPEDRKKAMAVVSYAMANGGCYSHEYRIIRQDGAVRVLRSDGEVILDEAGRPWKAFGTMHDITERKQAEKDLADAKDQAELYLDLMGHDINNMNQIAMGYLEMASDILDNEGRLEKEHQLLITKPMEMLRSNSELISNVRKLQRERAGDYMSRLVDVEKVLAEVAGQFSGVRGREVTMNLEACPCRVEANELLRDVFQNLVGNAVKHSKGPLTINIKAGDAEENGRRFCRVSVEDNGPGIPDDVKKNLFKRISFKKTKASGKGFGLCLTKMLVENFGGKIWVEDRVSGDHTQGSRFIVILPAR
jgi:PAS domain S-box-containing protein